MINFEEELAKFEPSQEIAQIEDTVLNDKMTDITDIMRELLEEVKQQKKWENNGGLYEVL